MFQAYGNGLLRSLNGPTVGAPFLLHAIRLIVAVALQVPNAAVVCLPSRPKDASSSH